jgi:hypothetical protein
MRQLTYMIKPRGIIAIIVLFVFTIIILFLLPYLIQSLNALNHYNPEPYPYADFPTVNGLSITPNSSDYFPLNYPTSRLYIEVNSGNLSALQPVILNNASFSLYRQGRPFQPTIGTNDFLKNTSSNQFVFNNSIDMNQYIVIINSDVNSTANVTIFMFVPL